MRRFANSLWITVSVLACAAGCIPKPTTKLQQIQIVIDRVDSCRIDQDEPVRLTALPTVLRERRRQIKQSQAEPAEFTIRIRVDDAAPYSSFRQVVEACCESGFLTFELVVAELVFPFDLTQGPSGEPDDFQLPPLQVRMQADANGELAILMLNDRRVADVAALQLELIALIGDERGPGSIQDACELEFDCDDTLQFRHLSAAYLAVSGYEADDGSRVVLVKTIWPMIRWPSEAVEVFEVPQEMPLELLEVDSLDAGTIDCR